MSLPGRSTTTVDQPAPRGPRLRLATPFVIAELEHGGTEPLLVNSLRDLQRQTGARTSDTADAHDWLDAHFQEGGVSAYVLPLRGPAAAVATHNVMDGAGSPAVALTVSAIEPGAYWNGAAGGLSVDIDVSSTNFEVKVYLDGTLVETSGMVATGADAAAWAAASSNYVTITDGPGVDPVATGSAANLTGGADDFAGITTTEITAAATAFSAELGPGHYVLPGRTDTASILAVAAVADGRNRLVKADLTDTATVGTLTTAAATLRASDYADIIDILAPRVTIPGLADGTSRTVPLSAIRSGIEGRNDQAGESPNQPAAGRWGITRYAIAVSQAWGDTDRETLNDAGVNIAKIVDGDLRLYGARTAADPTTAAAAVRLGSARLRMAIAELTGYEAERLVFGEVDQGGVALGNLKGAVKGRINTFARSLYFLSVDAELLENDDAPGTYYVEVTVTFQAAPDAERVSVIIVRAVTQV